MKKILNRYLPLLLALFGALIILGSYLIDTMLGISWHWLAIGLLQAVLWGSLGRIIQRLNYHAYTDPLTGLWNRRFFNKRLTEEICRIQRSETTLCVALIDTDNFKVVNDRYGHSQGDEVLKSIASIMKGNTRSFDVVTRWGGDEFAIIFPETPAEGAMAVAERIRRLVEQKEHCHEVTISVGIIAIDRAMDMRRILEAVDQALYKSKESKNNVTLLTAEEMMQDCCK